MHEHQIRDYFVENLPLLSPELEFVEKEFKVEPVEGSRGYIDILATAKNKYVIIEIKRSNQSARSTTNEISKYVEGLKRKLSLNNDDIRVLVISTHWEELTVPYAYMAQRLGVPCEGYLIEWSCNTVIQSFKVEVPELIGTRLFSPSHLMYMYHNYSGLEKGRKSIEKTFLENQVKDYVIIILRAPPGHYERVAISNRAQAVALGIPLSIFDGKDERYDYSLYVSFLRKNIETYRNILSHSKDFLEEADLCASDLVEEEEILLIYEENIWNLKPRPYVNWMEMGYPAKFAHRILEDEGWEVEKINRYGTLAANLLLSDEDIISEISGEQGIAKGRVRSNASIGNPAELSRLETEIRRCLGNDNITWREQLAFIVRSLSSDSELSNYKILLSLTSPNNFLASLFNQSRDPDNNYLPVFQLIVVGQNDEVREIYLGRVIWSGIIPDFDTLIDRYFEGDVFQLVRTMRWGGFLSNDAEIMKEVGISYAAFRVEVDELSRITHTAQLKEFVFVEDMAAFDSFQRFVDKHQNFIEELVERMGYYVRGNWFMSAPKSPYLDDDR